MTKKWTVHDTLFPFVCENDACHKQFDRYHFTPHARFEYVRLTNGEFDFVGLSCPSCQKTTFRKYSSQATAELDSDFYSLRSFIPFMADDALKLDTDDSSVPYFVPPQIQRLPMPDEYPKSFEYEIMKIPKRNFEWFERKCLFEFKESDIQGIIEWENQHQRKVFPRIIWASSVYHTTDRFLWYMNDANSLISAFDNDGMAVIWLYEFLLYIANNYYLFVAETHITKDEFLDFPIKFITGIDYGGNFVEICSAMLKEYIEKRSKFGFEQTWKTDFMDKYLRYLFYNEGYYKSDRYYKDKWEYEEINDKIFKGSFMRIDDSQLSEIMSCQQVVKQLGIEPIILVGFIANGDLPAYSADRVYFDWRSQSDKIVSLDPEKLLFLSSEVDELIMKHPHLAPKEQSVASNKEVSPKDKKAIEWAQLDFEESQWDASIHAAIQIGLACAEGNTIFSSKTLIKQLDENFPEIPVSTIKAIWEALPEECKQAGNKIETKQLCQRKDIEYREHIPEYLSSGQLRNLPNKRKNADKIADSLKSAFQIAMYLKNNGEKVKREEIKNKIDELNIELTSSITDRIIRFIPKQFRLPSGNPRRKEEA